MDDFTYQYPDNPNTLKPWNRLDRVEDDPAMAYTGSDDIKDGQTTANYQYDKLGQLTKDIDEGISNIIWRKGDKKIKSITRNDQDSPQLEFVYDPFGVRVLKIVKPRQNGQVISDAAQWRYTYYAHDANGQVMAVYDLNKAYTNTGSAKLTEQHLYGASRLGLKQRALDVYNNGSITPSTNDIIQNTLGEKRYEISNHPRKNECFKYKFTCRFFIYICK